MSAEGNFPGFLEFILKPGDFLGRAAQCGVCFFRRVLRSTFAADSDPVDFFHLRVELGLKLRGHLRAGSFLCFGNQLFEMFDPRGQSLTIVGKLRVHHLEILAKALPFILISLELGFILGAHFLKDLLTDFVLVLPRLFFKLLHFVIQQTALPIPPQFGGVEFPLQLFGGLRGFRGKLPKLLQ